ncbi:unnamed protein product [Kuraishia capsulata CBS 1993]|uniref:F-box domain-containing protein n=1 Tax=Kuraishia capsulata CBS 1993 TaxID=1382522 RepID=W6MLC8_9ASCO|nr:uncharacterized protein KUCA_T00003282001 [Kuraishia capsulata CBS 1993]CDK27304.1 unnamed protein product [Kuraishia capsulata CBS 1993]
MSRSYIDAPIGYAGAPLIPRGRHKAVVKPQLRDHATSGEGVTSQRGFSLLSLPDELLLSTFSLLSQYDVIKLISMNEKLRELSRKKLYESIVIDSNFSQFEEEYNIRSHSYIKSRYALRKFFDHIQENPDLAASVKSLVYADSAGEDGMLEVQTVTGYLKQVLPLCTSLETLDWFQSHAVDFKVLKCLGAPEKLRKLALSMSFGALQRGILEFMTAHFNLANLESLSIKPFHSSGLLANIIQILLRDTNISNLKSLRCVKHDTLTDLLKSPAATLPVSHESESRSLDLDTILVLCSSLRHLHRKKAKLDLEQFCLKSCIVRPTDFDTLNSTINLGALEGLFLEEMTVMDSTNPNPILVSGNQLERKSFLDSLGYSLASIQRLTIDIRQINIDSVPALIRQLTGLQELDVAIRWNESKLSSYPSRVALCLEYADAILGHRKTLKKLAIESSHEVTRYKRALLGLPDEMFESLFLGPESEFPELQSLRLNVPFNIIALSREILFSERLPKLARLWIFGQEAGGRPHMGLGNPFPGVFDEWILDQHVVYNICNYVARKKVLKYLKIEKCLFEIDYAEDGRIEDVHFKNNLDSWFDEKTRVLFKV